MRVGFVTTLLWDRFGPPWAALLADVGAEVVLPGPEAVVAALDDPRCAVAAGGSSRLALAAAVACGSVDLLVVPELMNPSEGGPGAAQDPWLADLPTMVGRALAGGAAVVRVPLERGPHVAAAVMPVLTRVNRDAGTARRAWERRRRELETPWRPPRAAPAIGGGGEGPRVALVGPPWWLARGGAALALRGADGRFGQHRLDPVEAREEGRRVREDLTDPDAEVIGAARRFGRRAEVDVVRLVLDDESPTAGWLERRVAEVAGRALETVVVADLADPGGWARALTPPEPGA